MSKRILLNAPELDESIERKVARLPRAGETVLLESTPREVEPDRVYGVVESVGYVARRIGVHPLEPPVVHLDGLREPESSDRFM